MGNQRRDLWGILWPLFEWPYLVLLNLWNHFYNFGIYLQEIIGFYRYPLLLKMDLVWMWMYALQSPFTLSGQATRLQALPADITVYGETPWITMARILEEIPMQKDDVFYELGCGTGRNLLFVHGYSGLPVVGFELVPAFVARLKKLCQHLGIETGVRVYQQNWFDADLRAGTIFFLVGTCYSDETIAKAEKALRHIQPGAWVISTSYALDVPGLKLIQTMKLPFSWGYGTVYIQQKEAE